MLKVQLEVLFKSGVEKYYIEKMDQEKFEDIVSTVRIHMKDPEYDDTKIITFGTGANGTMIRMSSVDSISISVVD